MTLPSAGRLSVKICGVTQRADAELAVALGADLLGLNFYPQSPRYIAPKAAGAIANAVRGRTLLVGVFVNCRPAEVAAIAADVGLDLLQFHGDEGPQAIAPFAAQALKVFRLNDDFDPAVVQDYPLVWGFLLDTPQAKLYGGSGQTWNFAKLARFRENVGAGPRTLIAGGLRPDNVRAALALARPDGIDVCSGVEASPGKKDPQLLCQLFAEIAHAESTQTA